MKNHAQSKSTIAAITLNPAIDQTISIPNFAIDQVNRVTHSRLDPGGKGVNVASILADRGLTVAVTGLLGAENSASFEELFARKGIEDRFVRIAGVTRTGIKVVDDVNGTTTDINFPGQTPTAADIASLLATVDELAATCSWFVLSGSVPAGAPSDIYARLIQRIRRAGRLTAVDTSGPALALALEAGPALVKPNIHEMEEILGRPLTDRAAVLAAAQSWRTTYGIEYVVVSMGEEGALLVSSTDTILAQPPAVQVASTVGAGDAMVSGLVAGLHEGLDLGDCARLATAFAAGAITFVGSGLPAADIIGDLRDRVNIQAIAT